MGDIMQISTKSTATAEKYQPHQAEELLRKHGFVRIPGTDKWTNPNILKRVSPRKARAS
jgi:hypothetical protein